MGFISTPVAAGPDTTVLVVGHSKTVPNIARALGDPAPDAVHARYGVRTESG